MPGATKDLKASQRSQGLILNANHVFPSQCVGPFSVGRKKRSPLFLNSNQVKILKEISLEQREWNIFDKSRMIDWTYVTRELVATSSDALLDLLVEKCPSINKNNQFLPPYHQNTCFCAKKS